VFDFIAVVFLSASLRFGLFVIVYIGFLVYMEQLLCLAYYQQLTPPFPLLAFILIIIFIYRLFYSLYSTSLLFM
jgi:hypothetical protein